MSEARVPAAIHRPVLVREALELLVTKPDGVYIDGTVGAGGHAEAILRKLSPRGRLLGIDRDPEILRQAKERLGGDARIDFHHGSYDDLGKALKILGVAGVDGILLDLGVSSMQLDEAGRGFSFSKPAPLDMRMDRSEGDSAETLLKQVSEKELERILREYGEERFSRRIAGRIVESRRKKGIATTTELAEIVARAVPGGRRRCRIHPATRTFQALRIEVNHELEILDRFLAGVAEALNPGGRAGVISYHSLEDRRVKRAFLHGEKAGTLARLTKKPVVPSREEVVGNPRGRSAKLRVAEKAGGEG